MVTIACWFVAFGLAAWALMRGIGLDRGFPLIALIAFTPHMAAAAVVSTVVLAWLRRRGPAAVALLAALALVAGVAPRALTDGDAAPARGGRELRVMSVNVAYGQADPRALVAQIREHRPDLLSIQELTPEFAARAKRLGLSSLLPHAVSDPRPGASGTGLYARMALERSASPRGALNRQSAARFAFGAVGTVEVTAVHPPPPTDKWAARWRDELETLRTLPRPSGSRLLAGDFNATLDHSEFRRLLGRGYTDAAAATGNGLHATWPSTRPLGPWVGIDHVVFDGAWRARGFEVLPSVGSDHHPILARLVAAR